VAADADGDGIAAEELNGSHDAAADAEEAWTGTRPFRPLTDDSLVAAKEQLATAVEDFVDVLRAPTVMEAIGPVDRANLAKYLTIAKLKLENAIALVRSGNSYDG
jgi:hypothetical protein